MKKLTLSLVAASLAASIGAYAAVPTGAAPFQVVVPNLNSGLDFTLEGLYVQPTNTSLQYLSSSNVNASGNGFNSNNNSLTPDYDFGFRLGLGYVFPNSGNDLKLSWTHFDQNSTDSVNVGPNSFVTTALGLSGVLGTGQNLNASSTASFKYDAVDLDVGQYLSFGRHLEARLFAGLRFAQLRSDVSDTYTGTDVSLPGQSFVETESFKSKFTGIGPRLGIATAYNVYDSFGVVAQFATSLLVGRSEASTNEAYYIVNNGQSTTVQSNNWASDNQTRVVPGFDAKLGIDYTAKIKDKYRLNIEAGYQVTQYVDAIDRVYVSNTTTSGIGFNGPYLHLNVKI